MTKRGGFPLGACGDDVPNLHLVVGDDDAIDQQFHQWSALAKGQLVQGGLQPPAKGLKSLSQRGDIHLLLRLRRELAQRLGQTMLSLRHLLSCALELVTPNDLCQVDFQQPSLLPFELGKGVTQGLAPGLQGLWQPFPAVGPCECMSDECWLTQDPTQILPHQLIQGLGWGKTRGAALSPGRPQGIRPTAAEIVVIAWGKGAPRTRQLTLATTDQAAEPVFMSGVVPAGHVGLPREAGLGRGKGILADDGRHREGDPFVAWGRPMTVPGPHRPQGGLADAGGPRMGALAVGGARIDWRAEDASHRGDMPARPPARRRDLVVGEALGHAIEGGRCGGAVYHAQIWVITAALTGSTRRRWGSRGRSGSMTSP